MERPPKTEKKDDSREKNPESFRRQTQRKHNPDEPFEEEPETIERAVRREEPEKPRE